MSEIDQQFIEYVVKSLVGKPDAVHIDRRIDEKGVLLELTVDPEDLGRVIGKRGATAQSLRTLLRALGTKNDARYNLKIIDNGPLDHGRSGDDAAAPIKDQPADDNSSDDNSRADEVNEAVADNDSNASEETEAEAEPPAEPQPEEPPASEPTLAEEPEQPAPAPDTSASTEDQTSDRLAKTREELADLDDLDV
jgi:predicted RNA-binding protein YlqC (UPF0109 family)